jgi:hypothetical protein
MTRGLLVGLVLGFALGLGASRLAPPDPPEPARPPERTSEGPRDVAAVPPLPPPAPPPTVSEEDPRSFRRASARAARDRFPERSWRNQQLIDGLRTLLAGGRLGIGESAFWEGQRIVSQAWGRRGMDEPARVPADLVAALLDSGDKDLRVVGTGLVALAVPPMVERIPELALRDPDIRVRCPAVGTIDRIAREYPELVEVLTSAVGDASPQVRIQALNALANLCSWRPDLGDWVISGTRDPDPDVREYTVGLLRMAGDAGTARATELLLEGAFDLDSLPRLLEAAVRGDGIGEVLDRQLRPEVVTELVDRAVGEEDEARVARALSGRFPDLLPLYQPVADGGYADFFTLAVVAGDREFLRDVIMFPGYERPVRLGALRVCLAADATRRLALEAVRALLRDRRSQARFRAEVVDECRVGAWEEEFRERALLREILEAAARDDPSPWVREAARNFLKELG